MSPPWAKTTYSSQITSDIAVGCYHIQIPGSYAVYRDAAADAQVYGGFVAWVNGAYQVRVGSYLTKADAQAALDSMTQGTIVGTSSYGINVVETGTDNILFQYDNSSSPTFAVPARCHRRGRCAHLVPGLQVPGRLHLSAH